MRVPLVAFGLLAACQAAPSEPEPTHTNPDAAAPAGDPLLTRARESMLNGELPEDVLAALRVSTDPVHERAQLLLGLIGTSDPDEDVGAEEPVKWQAPSLTLASSTAGAAGPAPAPLRAPASESGHDAAPDAAAEGAHRPAPLVTSAQTRSDTHGGALEHMTLKRSSKGARLILSGSNLSFSVVRQPERNVVRLVVDAPIAKRLLQQRPRVAGVQVTDVRQVMQSVFITVQLGDGWSLGSTTRGREGTSIHLVAPAS